MIDFEGMRVFVAIADSGTLTGAAEKLGLTKSTVSRRLALYEHQMGSSLFMRSTRSVSLTDVGRRHYERVRELIHEAELAVAEIALSNTSPSGLIRVSASRLGGEKLLAPLIWRFMAKFPQVKVELVITDEVVDLIRDGVDFALRMGELQDSDLLVRRLGKGSQVIVASPKLIEKSGRPESIEQLKQLPALVMNPGKHIWRFSSGDSVRVNWALSAGTIPLLLDACRQGMGAALLPLRSCEPYLDRGELEQLLPAQALPEVDISLVYPRLEHQSAAAKAFLAEVRAIDRILPTGDQNG